MKSLDTVILDVGGVLANYRSDDYYQWLGYPEDIARRLKAVTFESETWREYDRGVLTDEEIRNRFKVFAPELSQQIDASLSHMYGLITRRETAIPWICSIKEKGLKVYILSNFSYTAMTDCSQALDFAAFADGCFWSMQHKLVKPDAAIYLALFYEFGIDPRRAVFIDDTQENLDAAKKFGLRTILYKTQEQAENDLKIMAEESRSA